MPYAGEIAEWLHQAFLVGGILACLFAIGANAKALHERRAAHINWLRWCVIAGSLDLGAVWCMQVTGIIDLGAFSQAFAVTGAVVLITCHTVRAWWNV